MDPPRGEPREGRTARKHGVVWRATGGVWTRDDSVGAFRLRGRGRGRRREFSDRPLRGFSAQIATCVHVAEGAPSPDQLAWFPEAVGGADLVALTIRGFRTNRLTRAASSASRWRRCALGALNNYVVVPSKVPAIGKTLLLLLVRKEADESRRAQLSLLKEGKLGRRGAVFLSFYFRGAKLAFVAPQLSRAASVKRLRDLGMGEFGDEVLDTHDAHFVCGDLPTTEDYEGDGCALWRVSNSHLRVESEAASNCVRLSVYSTKKAFRGKHMFIRHEGMEHPLYVVIDGSEVRVAEGMCDDPDGSDSYCEGYEGEHKMYSFEAERVIVGGLSPEDEGVLKDEMETVLLVEKGQEGKSFVVIGHEGAVERVFIPGRVVHYSSPADGYTLIPCPWVRLDDGTVYYLGPYIRGAYRVPEGRVPLGYLDHGEEWTEEGRSRVSSVEPDAVVTTEEARRFLRLD